MLWLHRRGVLAGILHAEHLHDLGKLLFAFTTFWAYTWFSQYMLIWYADLPEEALYFTARAQGFWQPVFWAVLVLHWALPFALLLTRKAKRSPAILVTAACSVLLGRFLDLALTVLPAALPEATGNLRFLELALCAGLCGLGLWAFAHALRRASMVPNEDPYLEESLEYNS